MDSNFFDKKTRSGEKVNEQLAEELHKPNQINYGLIKEENFIINFCKTGSKIIILNIFDR